MPRTAVGQRLSLTVTALAVYHHPVVRMFVATLQARLYLAPALRERIHTALQEAMMNAMLHGNLKLEAGLRDNLQALARSRAIVEARLRSSTTARSLIRVEANWDDAMLHIVVRDSGTGFDKNNLPTSEQRLASGCVGSGRGLILLQTLCDQMEIQSGGTAIALGFCLVSG